MKKLLKGDFIGITTLCLAFIFAAIWLVCGGFEMEEFNKDLSLAMKIIGFAAVIVITSTWTTAVVDWDYEDEETEGDK